MTYLLLCSIGFFLFSVCAVFWAACVAGSNADDITEELYYKMIEERGND